MYMYIINLLYLQDAATRLFKWFSENQMKGNKDKCHLLMRKDNFSEIHIGEYIAMVSCSKFIWVTNSSDHRRV